MAELRSEQGNVLPPRGGKGIHLSEEAAAPAVVPDEDDAKTRFIGDQRGGTLLDAVEALGLPMRCGVAAALLRLGAIRLDQGRFVVAHQPLSLAGQPEPGVPIPIDDADTVPYEVQDRPQRVRRQRPRRACPPSGVPVAPPGAVGADSALYGCMAVTTQAAARGAA